MSGRRTSVSVVRISLGLLVAASAASCGGDDDPAPTTADAATEARPQDARSDIAPAQEGGRDATAGQPDGSSADVSTGSTDARDEDTSRGTPDSPPDATNTTEASNPPIDGSPDGSRDASPDRNEIGSGDAAGDAPAVDASVADGGASTGDETTADASIVDAAAEGGSSDGSVDADTGPFDASDGAPIAMFTCAPPQGTVPPLTTEIVAQGLATPVGVEASLHDASRLYVLEKAGTIRLIKNGVLLDTPFLDLTSIIWHEAEAGLLGLAFHPNYEQNGRFWVYYGTAPSDGLGSLLSEFHRSDANPDVADPAPVGGAPIFRGMISHIHQGGGLEFGGDGNLYLAMGERGTGDWAQQLIGHESPLGKILRFDVTTYPYTVPPGNLPNALPIIWDYGLRNPWRISFDRCNGDFYIADVGELEREEINIEPPGQGNRNYGWPATEGTICHPVGSSCVTTGITFPAMEYGHNVMNVIIGGYVYRGSLIPALRGKYVYGDITGNLYWLTHSNGLLTAFDKIVAPVLTGTLVSFGQDANGEIYTSEQTPGIIRRIKPQ